MAFTDSDKEKMDMAAADAEEQLGDLPEEHIKSVANWMNTWYMKAGYKRLSKILLQYAD